MFSAAQQKTVQNTRYNIMETSPEETMVVIVQETKRLKPKTKVERIKLEEVWISVPCNTYCKMGYINGEHQFRDKADPGRGPIQGTAKGKQAEEAGGRSYLISEGYSTEVEIITQAEAWLLLGRAAHTTLPIP